MGAMGESIAAYAQPLLDDTDGSIEQLNKALSLGQICWNLAIMPEELRKDALIEMRQTLKMEAGEFEAFQRDFILPMIRRHEEIFPHMHGLASKWAAPGTSALPFHTTPPVSSEKYPGTGRNAPCPCNSGKKYKKCCGL
jgi:uncharacterized protein YecA (UPF0149 family)